MCTNNLVTVKRWASRASHEKIPFLDHCQIMEISSQFCVIFTVFNSLWQKIDFFLLNSEACFNNNNNLDLNEERRHLLFKSLCAAVLLCLGVLCISGCFVHYELVRCAALLFLDSKWVSQKSVTNSNTTHNNI